MRQCECLFNDIRAVKLTIVLINTVCNSFFRQIHSKVESILNSITISRVWDEVTNSCNVNKGYFLYNLVWMRQWNIINNRLFDIIKRVKLTTPNGQWKNTRKASVSFSFWIQLPSTFLSLHSSVLSIIVLWIFLHKTSSGPCILDFKINTEWTWFEPLFVMGVYGINIHNLIRFYQGCHHCHLELRTISYLTWAQFILTFLRHHQD